MQGATAIIERFTYFLTNAAWLTRALVLALSVILVQSVVIGGLAVALSKKRVEFVTTDTQLRLLRIPTTAEPYVSDDRLLGWVSEAVVNCMTVGFADYQLRMQQCQRYFTSRGFEQYLVSQQVTKFRQTLKDQYQVLATSPSGPAVITGVTSEGEAVAGWGVEIPVVSRWSSGGKTDPRKYLVTMKIVRVPNLDNYGVAIDQIVVGEI